VEEKKVTTIFSEEVYQRSLDRGWNTSTRKLPEVPQLTFGQRIMENWWGKKCIELFLLSFALSSFFLLYEYSKKHVENTTAQEYTQIVTEKIRKRREILGKGFKI
jgi:hypothetical protein